MAAPILLDIPESFETERLLIRVPRPGDGAETNAAIVETFESLHAWMDWAKELPTVVQTEEYCRLAHSKFIARQEIPLRLIHKETGLCVGSSGFGIRNWDVPALEIGYWCRKRFEGQGYISEAVRSILKFGFETLAARRIEIRCDSRNTRSIRVAERVGMKREAELRNHALAPDGSLRDTLIFALTDEDWKNHV
jgi:RimJ/RimL family protein N-acetyltransferase